MLALLMLGYLVAFAGLESNACTTAPGPMALCLVPPVPPPVAAPVPPTVAAPVSPQWLLQWLFQHSSSLPSCSRSRTF